MNSTIPNAHQLSEQQRMEDILTQEKYMISAYSSFLPEADCPGLRQVLMQNLEQSAQSQFTVFDKMNSLGWYPTKPAEQADVQAARTKFAQMKQEING